MYVKKNFGIKAIIRFTGFHIIWLSAWAIAITLLYEYTQWYWFTIPWLPLSVIGTAVAFYIGFKSNNAYDRLWEARKIWGAIVNSSRSWGAGVRAYVSNEFTGENNSEGGLLISIKKTNIQAHRLVIYIAKPASCSYFLGAYYARQAYETLYKTKNEPVWCGLI